MTEKTKTCRKCNSTFKAGGRCLSCFAAYMRKYREVNKEKCTALSQAYYLKNKEKIKSQTAKWQKCNPSKMKGYINKWKEKNPGYFSEWRTRNIDRERLREATYRAKKPEVHRLAGAKYARKNKDLFRLKALNRRALIRGTGEKLSKDITERLFDLQKGLCPCCRKPLGKDFHIDHIVPLAKGGSNTDGNVQLLRAECNLKKSARHPIEYMQSKGFLL